MLYQTLRFTEYPEIQKEIIKQKSPMSVKMISKKYKKQGFVRQHWGDENRDSLVNNERVELMEWCLRLKLRDNFKEISSLFFRSKDFEIVEHAPRKSDIFWGAYPIDDNPKVFVGINMLGKLWMKIRDEFFERLENKTVLEVKNVETPTISNLKLLGKVIEQSNHFPII